MWWLLLPAALLVSMAILAIGVVLSPKHPQHARPRHLAAVPDPPPDYGSMILDAERTVTWDPPAYLLAAPVDPEPWRARTLAELSPEALDPGPGDGCDVVSSPPPGPDHSWRDEARSGMIVVIRDGQPRYEYPHEGPPIEPEPPSLDEWRAEQAAWRDGLQADLFAWVRQVHAGALA